MTVKLKLNGIPIEVDRRATVLEAASFLGIDIPTLCHHEGLSPYGVCRLCIVEARRGKRTKMVTSCTCAAEAMEGFEIRTHSGRVIRARRVLIELLLAECPTSKVIQDLASKYQVKRVRFRVDNKQCILCGLCVRICAEQMASGAIGYINRGNKRRVGTPFDMKSDVCRTCGACVYICPACQLRCLGPDKIEGAICGSCAGLEPSCSQTHDDYLCFMGETGSCGTCVRDKK